MNGRFAAQKEAIGRSVNGEGKDLNSRGKRCVSRIWL